MKNEQVVISESAGLGGTWRHVKTRKRLLVICHGFRSSSKNKTLVVIEQGLNEHGHDTFMFDFTDTDNGFDIEKQVQDIQAVVDHFKNYSEVYLLAASFAALTCGIAASGSTKISGLATTNGFFGKVSLGKAYRNTYLKFRLAALFVPKYRRILRYYQKGLRPENIKCPVLVIHSPIDSDVYSSQSRGFYKKLRGQKKFVELKNANHGITAEADRQQVISEIHTWISEN